MDGNIENKLDKVDLLFKIIMVGMVVLIAYVFGYPSGQRLMVIGVLVIIFGYWWKYHNGWMVNGSEQIIENWEKLENKRKNNVKISTLEIIALSWKNSFLWMKKLCVTMGILVIALGYIYLLMKG